MTPDLPFVTYRMADGSLIDGEWSFVTDIEYVEDAEFDAPTEVIKETWTLVVSETLTFGPDPDEDEEP